MIDRFEDIIGWQKSKFLTLEIYKAFQHVKDYSFRDQIQRASVSIMNNPDKIFEISREQSYKALKWSLVIYFNSKAKSSIDLTSPAEPLAINKNFLNSLSPFRSNPSAMLFIMETEALCI